LIIQTPHLHSNQTPTTLCNVNAILDRIWKLGFRNYHLYPKYTQPINYEFSTLGSHEWRLHSLGKKGWQFCSGLKCEQLWFCTMYYLTQVPWLTKTLIRQAKLLDSRRLVIPWKELKNHNRCNIPSSSSRAILTVHNN